MRLQQTRVFGTPAERSVRPLAQCTPSERNANGLSDGGIHTVSTNDKVGRQAFTALKDERTLEIRANHPRVEADFRARVRRGAKQGEQKRLAA